MCKRPKIIISLFFLFGISFLNMLLCFTLNDNNLQASNLESGILNTIVVNAGANMVHDSQVLSLRSLSSKQYTLVLYCSLSPNKYMLSVLDSKTEKIMLNADILSDTILGKPGWAPRFFQIDSNTVRIVFTLDKSNVFYRDFYLDNFKLSPVNRLKVKYVLEDGSLSTYSDLTLAVFSAHIKNTIRINLDSINFISFGDKGILIEGTDQLQKVNSKYYLTAEILSDAFKFGDTGGIACLMESDDLKNWILKKPIFCGVDASLYRNHEMSMTYLNNEWNGLSRYNTNTINGYMYWSSVDGDTWTNKGLAAIPGAIKGYRNSVCTFESDIFNGKKMAAIAYQKYDSLDNIPFTSHSSQRKSIGVCITEDFVHFNDIFIINDNTFNTYPSICIVGDSLFISWSSGIHYFTEKIKVAVINFRDLLVKYNKVPYLFTPAIGNNNELKTIIYTVNGITKIEYFLPIDGYLNVRIFDISGKVYKETKNGFQTKGYYNQEIGDNLLKKGIYILSLEFNKVTTSMKFIVTS